jgi:hypothetical protein
MWFKIIWAIDAVAAFGVLYFFVAGLGDGTVSSANIILWLGILASIFIIMYGSLWLKKRRQRVFALLLLLVLAVPALLYLLFISMALFGNQRWN